MHFSQQFTIPLLIKRVILSQTPQIKDGIMTISSQADEMNDENNYFLVRSNNVNTIIVDGLVFSLTTQPSYKIIKKFEIQTTNPIGLYNPLFYESAIEEFVSKAPITSIPSSFFSYSSIKKLIYPQ